MVATATAETAVVSPVVATATAAMVSTVEIATTVTVTVAAMMEALVNIQQKTSNQTFF